ncbi:tyrosine-protein phosphatase [Actinocorallia populi]|uniref:tyrosine-protein phosphatase n=1 Tax=Actinocorallia populi TaxID=2079200 RepID=UPI000D08B54C|nr:tyrosine-protein phosphatase [Actinocorallia populi]
MRSGVLALPLVASSLLIAGLPAIPASAQPAEPPRVVHVQGAHNVRDLGGYRGLDGRTVRYGRVYRSGSLVKATSEGMSVLKKKGITRVVDFRTRSEIGNEGNYRLPSGVKRQKSPVEFGELAGILATPSLNPAITAMHKAYRRLATDPKARKEFARTFRAVARADKPVLFHCTSGKDRTGVMSAILLLAVGVDRSTVYRDYLRSNQELEAYNKELIEYLQKEDVDPKLIKPALYVQRSFLDAWFAEVKKRYGGFDKYLSKGLGIKPAEKKALRKRLLK